MGLFCFLSDTDDQPDRGEKSVANVDAKETRKKKETPFSQGFFGAVGRNRTADTAIFSRNFSKIQFPTKIEV